MPNIARPVIAASLLVATAQAAVAEIDASGIEEASYESGALPEGQSAITAKVQVLLDRAGSSPGVIDGYSGENVENAIRSFEAMKDLEVDGVMDKDVWAALGDASGLTGTYTITQDDIDSLMPDLTHDYGKMAERERLGFRTIEELVAERYHLDVDFLQTLNPEADWSAGSKINVLMPGDPLELEITRLEADKSRQQLIGYDSNDTPVGAWPVTIGSDETPSPDGTHEVIAIAIDPTYHYNPDLNFQRGDENEPLTLPPGPNGPVGTVWIDLDKETYGLHGSDDPNKIGKTQSHGCVRLTNWDAEEVAGMVEPGVTVTFVE
jgi:lipoprotein-anchoring transpeptidase ErfK/SrfK